MASATNTVYIVVGGTSREAQEAVNQLRRALGEMGTTAQQTNSQLSGLNRGVADHATILRSLVEYHTALRAFTFFEDQARHMVKVSSEYQKLEYSMSRFSRNSEDLQKNLAWLTDLGQNTFGVTNVTRAFMELTQVGIKPTKESLEGLIGYMFTVGKTSPHEFSASIEKLVQLYQLGAVGMDDSLKEISKHFPFVMQALEEFTGKSFGSLMMAFRGKSMDFSTVITSLFEYMKKHYSEGIADTANFWDQLILQSEGRMDVFRQKIMNAGPFKELSAAIAQSLSTFDEMSKNGEIDAYAERMGKNLQEMIHELGGSDLTIRSVFDGIEALTSGAKNAAPTIRLLATAIGDLASMLKVVTTLFDALPDYVRGPAGAGLLGAMLFGPEAGVVIAGMVAVSRLLAPLEKMNQLPPWAAGANTANDGLTLDPFSNQSGGSFVKRPVPPPNQFPVDDKGRTIITIGGGDGGYTPMFEDNVWRGENKGATLNKSPFSGDYTGTSRGIGAPSTDPPGFFSAWSAYMATEKQLQAQMDTLEKQEATAGLRGHDLYVATKEAERDKLMKEFDKEKEKLDEMGASLEKSGQSGERIAPQIEKYEKDRAHVNDMIDHAIEADAAYWQGKNNEKWKAIEIGMQRFQEHVAKENETIRGIEQSMTTSLLNVQGKTYEAEKTGIEKQVDDYLKSVNSQTAALMISYAEMQKMLDQSGRANTVAGKQIQANLDAMVAGANLKTEKLGQELLDYKAKMLEYNRIMASGTFGEGLQLEAQKMLNSLPSDAKRATEALQGLQKGFDGLADSIATACETGKIDMASLATAFIHDLDRMAVKALITDPLLKSVLSIIAPSVTSMGGYAGAGTWGVPTTSPLWHADADYWFNEPTVAMGLNSGQRHVIGENGPEYLGKPGGRGGGNTISTTIQVTVQSDAHGNDTGNAEKIGNQVGAIVKVKFSELLRNEMRPGGALNWGVGG